MPKAILEYNLPEEKDEYQLALNAASYQAALQELDNWLRAQIKYANRADSTTLQEVRDKLYWFSEVEGISIF